MFARGLVILIGVSFAMAAEEPAEQPISLVDSAGKEHKLASVKWIAGAKRLAFLADPKGTTDDAKKGPFALEIREPNSTTFQKGVTTLIPISCVDSLRYDYGKLALSVAVKGQDPVPGTLQFRGINVLSLEVKDGEKPTRFTGGVTKDGFKSIAWPNAKPLPSRAVGTTWALQIVQPTAKDPTLTVRNLKGLYTFPNGAEELTDSLPVRKGEPLKLDTAIKKLEVIAVDPNTHMAAMELTVEGIPERLIAVPLVQDFGKSAGTLTGFLGEVNAGWKFFPLHAVKSLKPAG